MLRELKFSARNAARRFGYDVSLLRPDADVNYFLKLLCTDRDVTCIIDVGAHRGGFAEKMLRAGYTGKIVSFEPVLSHFTALTQLATRTSPNWQTRRMALGAEDGELSIHVDVGNGQLSSFLEPNDLGKALFRSEFATYSEEVVPVRRLDSVFEEVAGPGDANVLLKIDTQGWDMEVIKGATNSLSRVPIVLSEVSVQPIYENMVTMFDFIPHMQGLGYEIAGLFPISRAADYTVVEFDCAMVRPGSRSSGVSVHSTDTTAQRGQPPGPSVYG